MMPGLFCIETRPATESVVWRASSHPQDIRIVSDVEYRKFLYGFYVCIDLCTYVLYEDDRANCYQNTAVFCIISCWLQR